MTNTAKHRVSVADLLDVDFTRLVAPLTIDLEGDEVADSDGKIVEYTYAYVDVESASCLPNGDVLVEFSNGDEITFPADHLLASVHPVYLADFNL